MTIQAKDQTRQVSCLTCTPVCLQPSKLGSVLLASFVAVALRAGSCAPGKTLRLAILLHIVGVKSLVADGHHFRQT